MAVTTNSKSVTGDVTITFEIFDVESGGEPLWTESQLVAIDPSGHYQVQLGAADPNGLPAELFSNGEARWLEVQIAGEDSAPRVLLASVPYALKAADAATLGGLPASAFMLAGTKVAAYQASPEAVPSGADVTTDGGTAGYIPQFSGSSTIGDSIVYSSGTEIGIGTKTPTAMLTVDGTVAIDGATTFNGYILLNSTGKATTSEAYDSQPLKMYTSTYNSSTKAAVTPHFEWQAEATGNNTSSPGATLNLLATAASSGAAETGLYINTNGTIHFAPGQIFPGAGTGDGTLTGITAGTDLTGGGTTGKVTLNLDTTKVPTLGANNAFTGIQNFNGFANFNKGFTANAQSTIFTTSTGLEVYTSQNGSILANLDVPNGSAQYGWAIQGNAYNAYSGVYGYGDDNSQAGVIGAGNIGVYAVSDLQGAQGGEDGTTTLTAAVYAQAGIISGEGKLATAFPAAIFADGGAKSNANVAQIAVLGATDDNNAAVFFNNSPGQAAVTMENDASDGNVLIAFGKSGNCYIDGTADLSCTGTISGSNVTADKRAIATYGVQAAENWYEDAGSGSLHNGATSIHFDADFAQIANTGVEYRVFLTPNGDCKGLYVINKNVSGFEVRELGGGTSSITFDYRVMVKRKGYEQRRLADITQLVQEQTQDHLKRRAAEAHPARHPSIPPVPQRAKLPIG